ncbi:MAG: HYR domain-containing protein [Saprospiraceae bacterium]|nr:HYR domain-containing protein [Saprospiraceae bacterium]
MNNSTTPRRWALAATTAICLLLAQDTFAQCGDFLTVPAPGIVNITLNLTAMNGTEATLNDMVMTANGFAKDAACTYEISPVPNFSSGVVALPYTFTCADVGPAQTWYVRVNGPAGPSTPANFRQLSITVNDNIIPLIDAPANQGPFNADPGLCSKMGVPGAAMTQIVWPVVPPATVTPGQYGDNCLANLTYVLTGATTGSGAGDVSALTFNVGVTTVTYTVTDGKGNTASDQFTVTVVDAEAPTVGCFGLPAPPAQDPSLIFGTSDDVSGDCVVNLFTNSSFPFSDNCPGAVASWSMTGATVAAGSGAQWSVTFNVGTTIVEHKATDGTGATATCNFQITVVDDEPPTVACPANFTRQADLDCDYDVVGTEFDVTFANANDNCSLASITNDWNASATLAGAAFAQGTTTTVIWTVTDGAGLTGTCSYTITVQDTTPPAVTVSFPTSYNVNVTPGDCSATVTIERPVVSNCVGPVFDNYTVSDCDLPSFAPVEGVATVFDINNNPVSSFPLIPALNVCTPAHKFLAIQFPVGTTRIPYTWCDAYNNCTTITIEVVVNEPQAPNALCKPAGTVVVQLGANGQGTLLASQVDNGSNDNCGAVTLSVAPSTFTCANLGSNAVTLTVDDLSPLSPSSTCNTTITVVDVLPPVANCPTNIAITADASCETNASAIPGLALTMQPNGSALNGPGQYQDNCGVTVLNYQLTGANFSGPASGAYPIPNSVNFKKGLTPVTYTFIDAAGNSSACSFNVNITDLQPPTTANCPNPPPVNANLGGCLASVTWTPPTFTDNCPGNITVIASHNPGAFFFFGTTQVTYTALDAAGNVGLCTFNVVVTDVQPPVANCKNITVALNAGGTVTVTPSQVNNNSTDNCFFSFTSAPAVYTCANIGANTYTLIVTDGGGLSATCNATVTVTDTLTPSITNCGSFTPSSVSLNANCSGVLDADIYAANFTITDNTLNSTPSCPLSFAVSVDGSGFAPTYQWNCNDVGTNVVTFRAMDVFGNTAVCTKTITVNDVTPPVIINANAVAPPAVTVQCNAYNPTDFAVLGQITLADVTDACDDACNDALSITYNDATTAGSCLNSSVVTRTWTVTDKAGNTTTHVQVFSVVDTQAPTFSGVQTLVNLQANNQNGAPQCVAPFLVQLTPANIQDNCNVLFGGYTINYVVNFPIGSMSGSGPSVSTNFPIGTSTVTFTVADPCANASQITITVVVTDGNGPVVYEPFGASLGNTNFVCDSVITIQNATGNCGNIFSWYRPFRRTTPFEESFRDCSTYTVTETISNASVQSSINASSPFVYNNPPVFGTFPTTFFPVGETVITYTATDVVGNTTVCSFTVRVLDTQAPTVACPSPQNLSIAASCVGTTVVPNYLNGAQVTDNCLNGVVLTQFPAAGTALSSVVNPVQAGETFEVKIVATDGKANNLADSCTFTVTLFDGTAPVPDEPILPPIISYCGKDTVEAPSATDCDGNMFITIYGTPSVPVIDILPPFMPGGPPRYVLNSGNYAITWSYTDPQNNTTTQLQSVQIFNDTFPPISLCKPAFTVNLTPAGDYALSLSEINNGSFDQHNCGPVTLSLSPSVLTCANLNNPVDVTLTVTDVANNFEQCITQVLVKDVTAPVLSPIPADITLEACTPIPNVANITAVDACDPNVAIDFVQDTTSFTNIYKYTLRRTWKATDDEGNVTTGTQIIVIQDTQAPVFAANAPDTLVVFTDPNNLDCKDTVAINIAPFVSDCDSTTLVITNNRTNQGANYSEILAQGTYTLVFTAIDGNNNVSTKTIVLQVKDGTNPIAACINGISIALQSSGTVTVTSANINASSSDNCTPQNQLDLKIQRLNPPGGIANSITFGCADADGTTQHPVRLHVKDLAGNQSVCETFVVVQDNVVPTITSCPQNKVIQCTADFSPAANGSPLASDNCTVASINFTDSTGVDSTGAYCNFVYRIWKALDQANNAATCVQVFSVQDTVKPILSAYPPDDTVSCSAGLPAPSLVTATDNCSQNVDVQFQQDTIDFAQGPCGQFSYTVVRTRTAVDDCGNVETHTRKITVVDNEAPLFLGMPDTITVRSADYPPNLNCLVPVSLNISQYITDCQPDSLLDVTNNAPQGNGGFDISGNYSVGLYHILFTATDACGNVNTDSIVVNVVDNSIPTLICNNNIVIALGTNGEAILKPTDIDLGSTDNCGIDTMFLSKTNFDCQDLGINAVTLTAVDAAGNSNLCTVNVEVTLGNNAGFTLSVTGTPESFFGANDGTATAIVTGGSGQFSYTWSNAGTTPAITGLSAGIYSVTVVDSASGCLQVDTAVVEAGDQIKFVVGSADGCNDQIVSVPVTIDNCEDVTGFQFTLNVADDMVGTILGLTAGSLNPAVSDLVATLQPGNNLGIIWVGNPLTLPNGTVLFSVDILMDADAPIGSMTAVSITDMPVDLIVTVDSAGAPISVMVNTQAGKVEIACNVADLQIGGDIQTWNNPKPVPGVNVSLTGDVMAAQTTGLPGTYLFGVPNNSNTTVACEKSTPGNNGITGADILLIKRHVLNIQSLTSPYQFVAADVSGDGQLSLLDYARIQQVALGLQDHITGSPDWKFIPKSYTFPSPNPISVAPPQSISHTPANMDFLDDDFVAVRMGDVNGNITPSFTGDDDADDRFGAFRFRLEERTFSAGEIIEVPFKATDFTERSGYQMTLHFDPKVFKLESIEPGVLPEMGDANFGTMRLNAGLLTTLWVTAEPMTIADGETLFTLRFKVLRNGSSLAEVLRPGSDITRAEGYDRDGNALKLDFEFVNGQGGTENATFALYQNQPNPFDSWTAVGFRLPEAGRATFRVFSVSGQLVKTVVGSFEQGYNELRFRRDELGAPGVYYYELETAKHSARKKMILID